MIGDCLVKQLVPVADIIQLINNHFENLNLDLALLKLCLAGVKKNLTYLEQRCHEQGHPNFVGGTQVFSLNLHLDLSISHSAIIQLLHNS